MYPGMDPNYYPNNIPDGYVWYTNIVLEDESLLSLNERLEQLLNIGIAVEDITIESFTPKGNSKPMKYIAIRDKHKEIVNTEIVKTWAEVQAKLNNLY